MAFNYGRPGSYQQIPDNYNLKPVYSADATSVYSSGSYPGPYENNELQRLETQDVALKHRIRVLRVVSRVLAVIIGAATVAPLAMTLVKFFETRNVYFTVDGERRTAWASGTITWYTYLYFGVSTVSLILDTIILIFYCRGIRAANKAATVAGIWSGILLVVHAVIWAISVAIYRYGKEPVNGDFKDLWGWTCSTAADEIQSQITDIDFSKYCTIQVSKISKAR